MSSVRRLGVEKVWIVAVAMIVTAVTIAFLYVPVYVTKLLGNTSAPVRATPRAAGPSYQGGELAVMLYANPDDPAASERAWPERSPMVQNPQDALPVGPAANLEPSPAPNPSPKGSEQPLFKSRRALETMSAQDFLRRAR
jgi:hypothetical protein